MFHNKSDILWLIWRNNEGTAFKIGELHKRKDKYYFKYDVKGVEEASKYKFKLLPYLPKVDSEYFREELFRTFSDRIPNKSKRSTDDILKQYGLEEYDEFEILKRSGGKIENDNLEFVDPKDAENLL